MYWERIIIFPN